jgi:hypothetical protein
MEATRVRARLAPTGEWLVAAIFLLATVGVSVLLVDALRTSPPVSPRSTAPAPAAAGVPAAVPAQAISVPVLMLADGTTLRIGDGDRRVSSLLRQATLRTAVEDAGALGRRVTRAYEYRGTRFLLVLEPFERGGELRVASLYLQ